MKTRWKQLLVLAGGALLVAGCLTISAIEYADMHQQGTVGILFVSSFDPQMKGPQAPMGMALSPGTVVLVVAGSSAQKAGIAPYDRILALNGIPISEKEQLNALDKSIHPGDVLLYRILRGEQEFIAPLRVESLFHSTGWLIKAGTQFSVGLVFLGVGWLVLWKKLDDRRAVIFYWLSMISGIVFTNLPAYNNKFLTSRLGWQPTLLPSPRQALAYIPIMLGFLLVPLLLHLVLVFPKEHRIVRKYPAVLRWIYWLPCFGFIGLITVSVVASLTPKSGLNPARVWWLPLVTVAAGLALFLRTRYRRSQPGPGWKALCTHHPFLTLVALGAVLLSVQTVAEALLHQAGLGKAAHVTVTLLILLPPVLFLLITVVGYPVASCWALFTSFRESSVEEKRQLKWPLWGIVVSLGGRLLLTLIFLGLIAALRLKWFLTGPIIAIQEILAALLAALIPVSFAVAILKYRLMEIDIIIKRTVLYSLLTGIIVALYLVLVGGFGGLLVRFTGMKGESVAVLATVLVAAAFLPIRNRVQGVVDRRFFRKRYDYPQLLRKLREQMLEAATLNNLLTLVVETAQQALTARTVAFFLADDTGVFRVAAKIGLPDETLAALSFSPASPRVLEVEGVHELEDLNWPEHDLAPLRAAGAKFVTAVRFKGQLQGILSVGTRLSGEAYDTEDREFLALLAEQVAAGIDNHRLREQERDVERGREIQQALLPKQIPQVPGYSIAGAWQPARRVSGDYYDVLLLSPDKLALCIADVAGKGLPAALLMSNLQAAVKSIAVDGVEPRKLCENVNRVICGNVGSDQFISFFFCVLDTPAKRLVYTNAGHNPPLVVRGDGSVARLHEGGPVLGVIKNSSYGQGELQLAAGDRLLLFTDGVSEATNADQEEFGEERLTTLLRSGPAESAETLQLHVMQEVTRFCAHRFQDDATVLALVVT